MREFTIGDTDAMVAEHKQNIKSVLETIPDLENDQIEAIISLQKGESISWGNIIVIRTN